MRQRAEKSEPVSIRFPVSIRDRMRVLAIAHLRSLNAEVLHALREYILAYDWEQLEEQEMRSDTDNG